MNEYRGDRIVAWKLLTVDGNDNFRRLPSPLVNGKLILRDLKYRCRKTHKIAQIRHVEPQKRQHTTIEVGLHLS